MRGTFEQLREQNPGKWLLIRLDGPAAEAGTLLAADEDPDVVSGELERHFTLETSRLNPLYVTYAVREGQDLPVFALQRLRVPSVPGEAKLDPRRKTLAVVQGVALGVMHGEQRIDAVVDTGATYCVVPRGIAHLLGFTKPNRLGVVRVDVVGGTAIMDRHTMEYMRVGAAMAYRVDFLVSDINRQNKLLMLLGLSFFQRFDATTLDLDGGRVVFRGSRQAGALPEMSDASAALYGGLGGGIAAAPIFAVNWLRHVGFAAMDLW